METCCGYGYGLARDSRVSVGFSRVGGSAPDTARAAVLYGNPVSLSPGEPIPGIGSLTKKRELFPGPSPTSPTSFALPHATLAGQSPCPGSGILTRLPFDGIRATTFCFFFRFLRFSFEALPPFQNLTQWRSKVPKSGGAHRHVIYVPSVKNQYKRVVIGYMVIY